MGVKIKKDKTVSFRLWPPYTEKLEEHAKAARMRQSDFARLATMIVSDMGLLDLSERLKRLEEHFIRLRKDFCGTPTDGESC